MSNQTSGRLNRQPSGAISPNQDYRNSLIHQDGFMVGNKDPNRAYRFLSRAILEKCAGFDKRGWEVITAANSKGECLISPWGNTATSGTEVKNGDLILGFMPKERHEAKLAQMAFRQNLAKDALNRLRMKRHGGGVESMDVTVQRPGKSVEQLGF